VDSGRTIWRAARILAGAGVVLVVALLTARVRSAETARTLDIAVEDDEHWWVGVVSKSDSMPFGRASPPFEIDLFGNTAGNQVQPLLLSTKGRYLWSEEPFRLSVRDGMVHVASDLGPLESGRQGTSLREAAVYAGMHHFPPSGKTPDPILFTQPQFNTWIELTYDQNQRDVLAYARAIVANGFPPGVLTRQLHRLVDTYGVDGFKLDGGDAELFAQSAMLTGAVAHDASATPNRLTEVFAQIGLAFPLNEYRATWKMGGQPLAQRLRDKEHTWEDLRKLVPGIINLGLMGYPFACPDMIGGGEYLSFQNLAAVDQELVVRAAQVHALMPMMQFSVAPWRVLDAEHLAIARRMAALHAEHGAEILALAQKSARTGEPILRSLEYAYPHQGYASVVDEFLLGPDILVAPVVEKGARQRRLFVPPGRWKADDGSIVTGPTAVGIAAPLERLPWYRRME
jgi:hypothetical protein